MPASNSPATARATTAPLRRAPTVLFAGPWEFPEFTVARQSLALCQSKHFGLDNSAAGREPPVSVASTGGLRPRLVRELSFDAALAPLDWTSALATLDEAIRRVAESVTPPELVLVATPRPGLVTREHVVRLGAVAPLARLVIVGGSWCEGEWRTGRPPLGAVRLYWHELGAWWRTALAAREDGIAPPWSAPLDEPRAGRNVLEPPLRSVAPRKRLAIDAIDVAAFEALAASLGEVGWDCAWRPRHRRGAADHDDAAAFSAGIWDGGQLDPAEVEHLRQFCLWLEPQRAPVLALVDYPRAEQVMTIADVGAAAMMGKPYQTVCIANELSRIVRR